MRDVIEQEFRSHDAATPPGLIESASILTTTNLAMKSTMLGVIPESWPAATRPTACWPSCRTRSGTR